MLHSAHNAPAHLRPFDLAIQLLINQAADRNILASNQVEPMADFGAELRVVWWPYNALDCLTKYKVGKLIAGQHSAGQCSSVSGEDEDLLYQICRLATNVSSTWFVQARDLDSLLT